MQHLQSQIILFVHDVMHRHFASDIRRYKKKNIGSDRVELSCGSCEMPALEVLNWILEGLGMQCTMQFTTTTITCELLINSDVSTCVVSHVDLIES